MDEKTLQFYSDHAATVAARYAEAESAPVRLFHDVFEKGGRILDVGCGSGRDVHALIEAGFNAEGVDACDALLIEARRCYPAIADRLRRDSLPELSTVEDASLDGVLCCAVLMHVPPQRLFDTLFNLRRVLRPGGRLLISTPLQGPSVDPETHRDSDGRLFNEVPPEQFQFLLEKVRQAIRDGPLYFAGGGGSGVFRYNSETGCVEMAADLWRELSLMGAWIADATVLRWAELTSEISQGVLRPSQVLDALLTAPLAERDIHAARKLYYDLANKVCVWTGVPLQDRFELDHAIPFALWRNNDLWNLLPASRSANQNKRDRLPSRSVLSSRQSCIISYWSRMRDAHDKRFVFEAERLTGPACLDANDWAQRLFGAVAEAVEFTAIQRGVDRWEPTGFRTTVGGIDFATKDSLKEPTPLDPREPLFQNDPPSPERFVHWVPFYELVAAAGAFGEEQTTPDPDAATTWVRVDDRKLTPHMFALRVEGRSMEPQIPNGSTCLFVGGEALAGTRQGRIVLVSLRDALDPETAGRLTVKRYWSEKRFEPDGSFSHVRIELRPINPDFDPIIIEQADEEQFRVIGEWLAVLRACAASASSLHIGT